MYVDTSNPERLPNNSVQISPIPRRAALYVGPNDTGTREHALRHYATGRELAVVAVYCDADFTRLIEDAQADDFDAVVISSWRDAGPADPEYSRLRDTLSAVSVRLLVADEASPYRA
jgi:hypothetical protein